MPVLTCDEGHTLSVPTTTWIDALTVDQMRFALKCLNDKIDAIDAEPKRCVWRVCKGGVVEGNYREEAYEQAADHLMRIYKESLIEQAQEYIEDAFGSYRFENEVAHISVERVSQTEYDTQWFPVTEKA